MRIVLVNMPWASVEVPSLAVGILKSVLAHTNPTDEVVTVDANLDLVDWLCERMPFTLNDYEVFSYSTYFTGCGDWLFTAALYDDPGWRLDSFRAVIAPHLSSAEAALAEQLHEMTPSFVAEFARDLAEMQPDVVGFTSSFQQNVAALATAKALKALDPRVSTVFGGANCEGVQGAAVHRNFPFVDYVVRGEGEEALPALLAALAQGCEPAAVSGLCWRDASGRARANPMRARPLAPSKLARPDFDGYFERLSKSAARDWIEPKLVVEGARGCWWGQKHHCTFCGLNGSYMQFRSKSPEQFFDELVDLSARHRILDFYVVDNILDMNYLSSLLPRIAAEGFDFRFHYEIKSNMKLDQLSTLRQAGVVHVQPGIESLNARILAIMEKGVTGCQNVRLLRDAETVGITMYWNYLYGFPGELVADYMPIVAQLPALHHLMPPNGATRIVLERFSPYFDDRGLGFDERWPAAHYYVNYDLPEDELRQLAYVFDTLPAGIDETEAKPLHDALRDWAVRHEYSRLSYVDDGESVRLTSERAAFTWHDHVLDHPLEVAVFRLLNWPRSLSTVTSLAAKELDRPCSEATVRRLLDEWLELGIAFHDAGTFVHVVPAEANQALLRIHPRFPVSIDDDPSQLAGGMR